MQSRASTAVHTLKIPHTAGPDRGDGKASGACGGGGVVKRQGYNSSISVCDTVMIYLSLHCHHHNDSCVKMGSEGSHFNEFINSEGQRHKTSDLRLGGLMS